MAYSSRDILDRLNRQVTVAEQEAMQSLVAPVEPRLAATVLLVRDGNGVEVYVQHRHLQMPFAAGKVVFPGGRVDPVDRNGSDDPAVWWRRCAVRELVEETGLRVAEDSLLPWAHWITPEYRPQRFDTYFYVAALPDGQLPQDLSGEATTTDWVRPQSLLAAADRGEVEVMAPTQAALLELADFDSAAAVVAAAHHRVVETVLPRPVATPDGWVFTYRQSADPHG